VKVKDFDRNFLSASLSEQKAVPDLLTEAGPEDGLREHKRRKR